VNVTIIIVTEVNRELATNPRENLVRTVVNAAQDRLRPVLLTTFTTVAGLLPTAYGLLFATIITLILTASLLVVGHDVEHWLGCGSEHKRGRN